MSLCPHKTGYETAEIPACAGKTAKRFTAIVKQQSSIGWVMLAAFFGACSGLLRPIGVEQRGWGEDGSKMPRRWQCKYMGLCAHETKYETVEIPACAGKTAECFTAIVKQQSSIGSVMLPAFLGACSGQARTKSVN
jgi:hypothetical protein